MSLDKITRQLDSYHKFIKDFLNGKIDTKKELMHALFMAYDNDEITEEDWLDLHSKVSSSDKISKLERGIHMAELEHAKLQRAYDHVPFVQQLKANIEKANDSGLLWEVEYQKLKNELKAARGMADYRLIHKHYKYAVENED